MWVGIPVYGDQFDWIDGASFTLHQEAWELKCTATHSEAESLAGQRTSGVTRLRSEHLRAGKPWEATIQRVRAITNRSIERREALQGNDSGRTRDYAAAIDRREAGKRDYQESGKAPGSLAGQRFSALSRLRSGTRTGL